MKNLVIFFLLIFAVNAMHGQSEKKKIIEGNEKFKAEEYEEAERLYEESLEEKVSPEALFNLGDALYRQGNFEQSADAFSRIIESEEASPELKSQAYHNLGNAYMSQQELEKGVGAYKEGLKLNPKDEDTRYNLSYALRQMKQQQEQQKQEGENEESEEGEDKEDQESQGNEDGDQESDEKKESSDKDGEGNKGDEKNQQPGEDEGKEKGEKEGEKPIPNQISKEDAARILNSLNRDEQKLQEKVREKKKGKGQKIEKDW